MIRPPPATFVSHCPQKDIAVQVGLGVGWGKLSLQLVRDKAREDEMFGRGNKDVRVYCVPSGKLCLQLWGGGYTSRAFEAV